MGVKMVRTCYRLREEEIMYHRGDLLINLRLGDYLRKILQDKRPRGEIRVFLQYMRDVNPRVPAYVEDKGRAVIELRSLEQPRCIIDLRPGRLPCCPGLHVPRKSFVVCRALLETAEEVQAVGVGVGVVVDLEVGWLFVRSFGEVAGEVVAGCDVLVGSTCGVW
jgi:hypothetical protein